MRSSKGVFDLESDANLLEIDNEHNVLSLDPSLTEVKFSEIIEGIEGDDGSIVYSSSNAVDIEVEEKTQHSDKQLQVNLSPKQTFEGAYTSESGDSSIHGTTGTQVFKYSWYNCAIFLVGSLFTFSVFTAVSYHFFGDGYFSNGVLYHFTRYKLF